MMLRSLLCACLLLAACSAPLTQNPPRASFGAESEPGPAATPPAEGPNLIPNPGAEAAANPARPEGWTPDSWGQLQANLSWQSGEAQSGQKFLAATVAGYQDGDAKWAFEPLALAPDTWYEYSDYSRSNGRSRLIWACRTPEGQRVYRNVWQSEASSDWKPNRFRFYNSHFQACRVSLMQVLDRDGWLHTDSHALRRVEPRALERPLISISFDDIYDSAVSTGAAELAQRGWKGSFYVTGQYAIQSEGPYADSKQIRSLVAAGHELGSHSDHHVALSKLPARQQGLEIRANKNFLAALGQQPQGLAYPFGDFDAATEAELKQQHDYARTSLVGLNDADTDPYRLRIFPVTSETTTSELLAWIEDAERTSTWLILLFHDLQPGKGEAYTTSSTQYVQVLDFIKRRKLAVLTVKDALAELRAQSDS